jgi:hypothetical protein
MTGEIPDPPKACREHWETSGGVSGCAACEAMADYVRGCEERHAASVARARAEVVTPELAAWREEFAEQMVAELRAEFRADPS